MYLKYELNDNIERIHEFITHDGYDVFGSESNLYDIYVWYKKNNICYIDLWHAEDWYESNKLIEYERIAIHHVNSDVYHKTIINPTLSNNFLQDIFVKRT